MEQQKNEALEMAVAAGGSIKQVIVRDMYNDDKWAADKMVMFNLQLFNAATFESLGIPIPSTLLPPLRTPSTDTRSPTWTKSRVVSPVTSLFKPSASSTTPRTKATPANRREQARISSREDRCPGFCKG